MPNLSAHPFQASYDEVSCNATFASEDAYQIHLGIGAPAFHACNDATEMAQKGMTQNPAGEWTIDEKLIEHRDNWAYKRN